MKYNRKKKRKRIKNKYNLRSKWKRNKNENSELYISLGDLGGVIFVCCYIKHSCLLGGREHWAVYYTSPYPKIYYNVFLSVGLKSLELLTIFYLLVHEVDWSNGPSTLL